MLVHSVLSKDFIVGLLIAWLFKRLVDTLFHLRFGDTNSQLFHDSVETTLDLVTWLGKAVSLNIDEHREITISIFRGSSLFLEVPQTFLSQVFVQQVDCRPLGRVVVSSVGWETGAITTIGQAVVLSHFVWQDLSVERVNSWSEYGLALLGELLLVGSNFVKVIFKQVPDRGIPQFILYNVVWMVHVNVSFSVNDISIIKTFFDGISVVFANHEGWNVNGCTKSIITKV
jgi:hypothetical protein